MGCLKTDEEVENLISHANNGIHKVHFIGSGNHGETDKGTKRAGEQVRATEDRADVGVLAKIIGNKATGELLGLGNTTVSQCKNGKNGSHVDDVKLIKEMESRLAVLENKASDKVDLFLDIIREEKVSELSADKAAVGAEKMVNVLDKLRRRNEKFESTINRPQVHIYGPVLVKSEEYITKEV